MIFLYYKKGNGQNYPKSLFLNAFINVEIRLLHNGSKYSFLLIKSDTLHSAGSNRAVVLTGAKESNRITLTVFFCDGRVQVTAAVSTPEHWRRL